MEKPPIQRPKVPPVTVTPAPRISPPTMAPRERRPLSPLAITGIVLAILLVVTPVVLLLYFIGSCIVGIANE